MNIKEIKKYVHFKNELYRIAQMAVDYYRPSIEKLVGAKVSVQGGMSKKFHETVNRDGFKPVPTPYEGGFASFQMGYFSDEHNNLKLSIKLCFSGGKYEDKSYYCNYESTVIYFGTTSNTILEKLEDLPPYGEPMNADNEIKLIEAYNAKKAELEAISNQIRVQKSMYDRY